MKYFSEFITCDCALNRPVVDHVDRSWPQYHSVQFLYEGKIYFGRDRKKKTTLTAPALYWIDPTHTYQKGPMDVDNKRSVAVFRGPKAKRLIKKGYDELSDRGYVPVSNPDAAAAIYTQLQRWYEKIVPGRDAEFLLLLERLLAMMAYEPVIDDDDAPHHEAIMKVAEKIRRSPVRHYEMEALAEEAHLSYPHFRRLFRKYLHAPPYDYLLSCRMQWAAAQLRDRTMQIKEIAMKTGYGDQSKFTRAFKKQYKLPPTVYREALT